MHISTGSTRTVRLREQGAPGNPASRNRSTADVQRECGSAENLTAHSWLHWKPVSAEVPAMSEQLPGRRAIRRTDGVGAEHRRVVVLGIGSVLPKACRVCNALSRTERGSDRERPSYTSN